ncbi:acyl-CoA reductase [Sungkyunkwania multivorans]|uniref:Acyl-CoA reductase n=1 Tax=Sungkyunkwania multivorans TaxID=1173618 RepID=A0ABW3CWZ1_9FLAO
MNTLEDRIVAFTKLGDFLGQFNNRSIEKNDEVAHNALFFDGFRHQIELAGQHNGWFTKENVLFACQSWSQALSEQHLKQWTDAYSFNGTSNKKVAIVMAGNIPLVGFHDFISVLMSGHSVLVKLSSNDKHLLPYLAKYLQSVAPYFEGRITFTEEKLEGFDAVIATGSDNTARYFDYYFGGYPNIIRKNRNSIAVLTGEESKEELEALGEDVFRYFGLGCRNVSKIFVPHDYDFNAFFGGMYPKRDIINNAKYANNYDYNKAVYLMSLFEFQENGFLMLKEDISYASPIASIFYEHYDSQDALKKKIDRDIDHIQCIVANGFLEHEVKFGETQSPKLWDYADGVDTIKFLTNL